MIKIINLIRKRICPSRLYKYGMLGLSVHDDRTKLEKIFDYLDRIAERIDEYYKQPRYIRKQVFHSFFDISTNQVVSSVSQIDDICKEKGLDYMSFKEIRSEANKNKRINEEEKNIMIRKDMSEIVQNVKRGKRSYKREIMKRIKNNEYTIGKQKTFN